jgi:hypothetical protein
MAREALEIIGARILIIDEIHALLVGGDRQQRIFLNVIRLLANDLEMPLVCAGTPEARRALMTDNGLADRFESVELPRWTNGLEFRRLLASFAAILPLRQPSDLDQEKIRTAILKLSDGITVRIVRLLERLAIDAILRGRECIELGGFDTMPQRAPLLSMERPRPGFASRLRNVHVLLGVDVCVFVREFEPGQPVAAGELRISRLSLILRDKRKLAKMILRKPSKATCRPKEVADRT